MIARQLNQLGEALAALGIPFSVLTVADYQQIPARLASYCQQHEVSQLFVNRDIGIYELARDLSVQQQCDATGIRVQWFDARCVFAPGSVLTGSKEMFKVFTPFSKAWLKKTGGGRLSGLAKTLGKGWDLKLVISQYRLSPCRQLRLAGRRSSCFTTVAGFLCREIAPI